MPLQAFVYKACRGGQKGCVVLRVDLHVFFAANLIPIHFSGDYHRHCQQAKHQQGAHQ